MATPLDLEALEERTRRYAGVEMETLWTPDQVREQVNDAYQEICDVERWTFLNTDATFDTVADEPVYGLPTAVREIYTVSVVGRFRETVDGPMESSDDGRGIVRRLRPAESDRFTDEPTAGAPEFYAQIDPDTLELWPAPDDVYTVRVRGWLKPAALLNDTDQPIFDDEFHPLVAYLAAYLILIEEGDDTGRIEDYSERIGNYLTRMRSRYEKTHDQSPIVLGGRAVPRYRRPAPGKLWA